MVRGQKTRQDMNVNADRPADATDVLYLMVKNIKQFIMPQVCSVT